MSFDPWKQAEIMKRFAANTLKPVELPEKDTSLDDLKRLAGTNKVTTYAVQQNDKAEYQRKHNIKPGTPAWFKLWFAQPHLTGESPYE